MSYYIGIDIGGTNIKAIAVDESGVLKRESSQPTRDGEFDGDTPLFAKGAQKVVENLENDFGQPALGIGISAPGLAARDSRSIFCIPGKMHGLENLDWTTFFKRDPVVPVLNDAHAALLGEAWVGAAAGKENVVMLTIGTGVGGAIICDGHLLKGHIGRAGHLGHTTVGADLIPDVSGVPGGLEMSISETFIDKINNPKFTSTKALADAYKAGDEEGSRLWIESVRRFAVAIASIVNAVDPEIVIIGGGGIKAGDALFKPLQAFMDEYEWRPDGHRVQIVEAKLDSIAGAYGAAKAALDDLK
ncbi:MAG: ROK family protein [Verrucomicrobiota bacterium]